MRALVLTMFFAAFLLGCISFEPQQNETPQNGVIPPEECVGCYVENETPPANVTPPAPPVQYNETVNETANETIEAPQEANVTGESNVTAAENQTAAPACIGPATYDIYTAGSVLFDGVNYADTCIVADVVKKHYCRNDTLRADNFDCPPGYWCQKGACEKFEGSCVDPDGNDTTVRATITVVSGPFASYTETDECEDVMIVKEWLCNESEGYYALLDCVSGQKCREGRCARSRCSETDGGDVPELYGQTEAGNETERDSCTGDHQLREYYCYGDDITSTFYKCADKCEDDECTPVEE